MTTNDEVSAVKPFARVEVSTEGTGDIPDLYDIVVGGEPFFTLVTKSIAESRSDFLNAVANNLVDEAVYKAQHREACTCAAVTGQHVSQSPGGLTVQDAIDTAVKAEREANARLAESLYDKTYWDDPSAGISALIRARGGKDNG